MAAHAVEEKRPLILRAGKARHPLGIAHLGGEITRLAELEIDRSGLLVGDVRGCRPGEIVAGGANLQRVFARRQAIRRKAVMALRIAYDADGDARAVLLG